MFKTGIRGHDVRAEGLSAIAERMKEKGLEYIQLVLEKSVPGFSYGQYSESYAEELAAALSDRKTAILGSYINPSDPDEAARAHGIERFKEKIRYAKAIKPIAVGTETGKYIEGKTHTEEAYRVVLESVKEIVAYAKTQGVNVGIEGVHLFVIDSPKMLRRLIDDVGEDNLLAIFDPVNLLNAENYTRQDEIINEFFELLHDRVCVLHVKDFVIEDGRMKSCTPLEGMLNYPLIFENLKKHSLDIPFITEEINEDASERVFEKMKIK